MCELNSETIKSHDFCAFRGLLQIVIGFDYLKENIETKKHSIQVECEKLKSSCF